MVVGGFDGKFSFSRSLDRLLARANFTKGLVDETRKLKRSDQAEEN